MDHSTRYFYVKKYYNDFSAVKAVCLSLHVLHDDIIDLAEGAAVLENEPGLVCVVMKLDSSLFSAEIVLAGIAGDDQAVSVKSINDMVADLIDKIIALVIIGTVDIQQELCVISEFNDFFMFHIFILFLLYSRHL